MKNLILSTLLLCICSSIISCGGDSVESEDLKTSGIYAKIEVTAWENTTFVNTRLTVSGPNGSDVKLSGGDSITANAYSSTINLSREPSLFGLFDVYIGDFPQNIFDERVTIELRRRDDNDALNTYVNLPMPFSMVSSLETENIGINESSTLIWENDYNGDIEVEKSISCTHIDEPDSLVSATNFETIPDNGSITISFNNMYSLSELETINPSILCNGDIEVIREKSGTLDSNYDGGSIKARQRINKNFTVNFNT